jgi:hypothetical protein
MTICDKCGNDFPDPWEQQDIINRLRFDYEQLSQEYQEFQDASHEMLERDSRLMDEKKEWVDTLNLLRSEIRLLNKRVEQLKYQLLENGIEPVSHRIMTTEYNSEYSLQNALSLYFDMFLNIIVDNLNSIVGHECDLLILNNKTLYAQEVEIKISKSDLKRDESKHHHHKSNMIRKLWFAFPSTMDKPDCIELVPENAGVLIVSNTGHITIRKDAVINKFAKKWTFEQAFKLARLASIRYWNIRLRKGI